MCVSYHRYHRYLKKNSPNEVLGNCHVDVVATAIITMKADDGWYDQFSPSIWSTSLQDCEMDESHHKEGCPPYPPPPPPPPTLPPPNNFFTPPPPQKTGRATKNV